MRTRVSTESKELGSDANEAFHVTAVRLQFLLKVKGHDWTVARDRGRSASMSSA